MSLLMVPGVLSQQGATGGAFDPETDITWHSLFWAEGTDFAAEGYSDTDAVTTWPNETAETDATATTATTYTAAGGVGGQPGVLFATGSDLATAVFSTNPTYDVSFVVIANYDGTATTEVLVDGIGSSNRNMVYNSPSQIISAYAGTVRKGATSSHPTGDNGYVATFDGSGGNETISINGTNKLTASAGVDTITGLSIGNQYSNKTLYWRDAVSFVGIYEGDITADGSWSDMQTWATDHYGVVL